jgi:hypothetical protein
MAAGQGQPRGEVELRLDENGRIDRIQAKDRLHIEVWNLYVFPPLQMSDVARRIALSSLGEATGGRIQSAAPSADRLARNTITAQ